MRRYWSAIYIIAAVGLTVIIGLLGFVPLPIRWLLIMAVFVALLVLIGRDITGRESDTPARRGRAERRFVPGRPDGVLIDLRHKVSLSRLQLVLWTVVVLSAWVTLALHRTIPVLEGQIPAANAKLVEQVAGLLAGTEAADETDMSRATAILEQLTGGEITDPAAGDALPAYSPLDIAFPPEVLAALGISIASMAGASVIKTNQAGTESGRATEILESQVERAEQSAAQAGSQVESLAGRRDSMLESLSSGLESMEDDPAAADRLRETETRLAAMETRLQAAEAAAAAAVARAEERVAKAQEVRAEAVGELHARTSFSDARWSDMLRGDTVANYQYADLGKIQMFFFTIVLVFSYAALVWSIMSMPMAPQVLQLAPSLTLPAFSESLVLILGLSHGGYLATKTAA